MIAGEDALLRPLEGRAQERRAIPPVGEFGPQIVLQVIAADGGSHALGVAPDIRIARVEIPDAPREAGCLPRSLARLRADALLRWVCECLKEVLLPLVRLDLEIVADELRRIRAP